MYHSILNFGGYKLNNILVGNSGFLELVSDIDDSYIEVYAYYTFLNPHYGEIYYRIIDDGETLSSIDELIQNNFPQMESYNSTFCLVATWHQVIKLFSSNPSKNNTFQIVFSSNSTHNFFLFNYLNLKWERHYDGFTFYGILYLRPGTVQYEKYFLSNETNSILLSTSSNFGVPGSFLLGFADDIILPNPQSTKTTTKTTATSTRVDTNFERKKVPKANEIKKFKKKSLFKH